MVTIRKSDGDEKCIVVIGAQWGNEGKGKLAHRLCETADVCTRFNGGANNIHTISVDTKGQYFVGRPMGEVANAKSVATLGLFPLGVTKSDCQIVFGNGMVLHLATLAREICDIQASIDPNVLERTFISTRAHIVFDFHQSVDGLFDDLRDNRLGTTQMGVGPAYSTKTIRNGLRMGDLFSERLVIKEKIAELVHYFAQYSEFDASRVDVDKIVDEHLKILEVLRPCIVDTVALMANFLSSGKRIVCEGSNSVMSDLDFGTYPYVTSSNTTPGSACIGLGIPPTKISKVVGVCKSYTTRAQHWFPSVLSSDDPAAVHLVKAGFEVGTKSKRARRVGWLDLVQLKWASEISGFDSLMLTKLDALSGLPRIGLVTGYKNFDVTEAGYPSTDEEFKGIESEIEFMPGWAASVATAASRSELPKEAQAFLRRVEEFVGVKIEYIQLGSEHTVLSQRDIIQA